VTVDRRYSCPEVGGDDPLKRSWIMIATRLNMDSLTEGQVAALRQRFPYQLPAEWVGRLAASDGWQAANLQFLEAERKRSTAAMRHLMDELGVERVDSREEALDLMELAFRVFTSNGDFTGTIDRAPDGVLRVEVQRCPVYQALEDAGWRTVTACPSWYRRRGWLDALGVHATDSLLGEKKWGDVACVSEIQIQQVA
jgi:hypothetical protein